MKRLILLFCFLLVACDIYAQVITTVAGNGLSGSTGDGGAATAARINGAVGGAFDSYGNYYVADILGNKVRKVTPSGIISTIAGVSSGGGYNGDGIMATAAKLFSPSAVCIDSINNIYIDDASNFRIRKIDAVTGIISTIAGTGVGGYSGDNIPATNAQLGGVQDICMDRAGNLYLADQVNQRVRKIDNLGIITSVAGGTFSSAGTGDGGPATDATFNYIFGVATDDTGNIFIADYNAATVRRVDHLTGIITNFAGNGLYPYSTDGVPATAAQLNPGKLKFNNSGNLTIADRASDRVYLIDDFGVLHVIAGNGSSGYSGDSVVATATAVDYPAGLVYDACGNLYIAESAGKRVRKVWFAGMAAAPVATITPLPDDTVCVGETLSLTVAVPAADTVSGYQWYVNGVAVSGTTGAVYSYAPANGDTISCRLSAVVACNGAFTVSSNTVRITTVSAATPTITISAVSTAAPGAAVTVTAAVGGAGGSYSIRWMNHGAVFATTTVPVVSYTKGAGTDTITARIVPTGSCYDSVTSSGHIVTADHTFVVQSQQSAISIAPNPVKDVLHILGFAGQISYVITSVTGLVVQTGNVFDIDMRDLPAGSYFLRVTGDGVRRVFRVVKE